MKHKQFKTAYLAASLFCAFGASQSALASYPGSIYENKLLKLVQTVESGQLDSALLQSEILIKEYPDSRVAYLIKGDVLSAMAGDLSRFAQGIQSHQLERSNFGHELKNRTGSKENRPVNTNKIPASILEMGDDKYVFVGEASTGRFYIFGNNNGQPYLVQDYYMSIGKKGYGKQLEGDNRTPLGLYSITREIDGKQLPDLYGHGAFPVNYPNVVDSWRKRTGYGIWLHGTRSGTYSRPPLSSEGCFVLSNSDFNHAAPYIRQVKKPKVLLIEKVTWLSPSQHKRHKREYLGVLQQWVSGWESLDVDQYLSFYDAKNFNFGKGGFNSWAERKKMIAQSKSYIQVSLGVESMYLYPGEKDMFTVNLKQNYLSNNYKSAADKTLYWKKSDNDKWKIIYENAKG